LFFISFFYFFPFNPPPFERRGQNFLIITLEGFRKDSLAYMPDMEKMASKGAMFQSLYLASPDFKKNIEKLFIQKEKCLLDFFPERYQSSFLVPKSFKDYKILNYFKEKHFYGEKGFYSLTLENFFFLKLFQKQKKYDTRDIFDLCYEKITSLNRPFIFWLHIDVLKNSIPENIKMDTLDGKIQKEILKEYYLKEISKLDHAFSKFFLKLQREKWFEKTNFLILGVSGFELLEHSSIGTGKDYYQESLVVPFIWTGPLISPKKIDHPISILDLYPTLLKKFNLSKEYKNFEGLDFTPSFENIFPLDRVFYFYGNEYFIKAKAFIKEDKKIILKENGEVEVYDLQKDPLEKINLYFLKDENIIKLVEEVKKL
ncbi:MAG: sulfatase-like hydrolase/transferase, partial [Thermoanaerobaculia bacterium]